MTLGFSVLLLFHISAFEHVCWMMVLNENGINTFFFCSESLTVPTIYSLFFVRWH